jgi:hypothetical protein
MFCGPHIEGKMALLVAVQFLEEGSQGPLFIHFYGFVNYIFAKTA